VVKRSIAQLQAAVEANPVHPTLAAELAQALFAAGDYEGATGAALLASGLGAGEPGELALLAARCALRMGENELAEELLFTAMDLRLRDLDSLRTDPDFAPLRTDPTVQQVLGIIDPGALPLDREDGWLFDIAFFEQEFRRRAPAPYAVLSSDELDEAISWLQANVPNLSDAGILLELTRLLVALQDGHAYVLPAPERADLLAALPLGFFRFAEGFFITAASPAYAALAGKQIVAIEGRQIGEIAEQIVTDLPTDNAQWPGELAPFRMRETNTLHAMGLCAQADRLTLSVMDAAGARSDHLVIADSEFPTAALGRNFPFPDHWVSPLDHLPQKPLYLRDLRTPFWYDVLPELDAVYLQINAVRDGDAETLAAFTGRFFAMLEATVPRRLIIDIRMNKGGNTTLEWPFLHRLIASPLNARGRLFGIIGRRTFSAAQNFATYLDLHTQVIFAGEPTGSKPTFNGESVEFQLPWSGTRVNISDLVWQSGWPWDRRPWIPPDLFVSPSFAAYAAGRDEALEAIAREIEYPTLF
jgi:hypothetical protein